MDTQIDSAMSARFLSALTRDTEFSFRTLPDGKGRRGRLIRELHGTFPKVARQLEGLNRQGAGVFVMVNRGDHGGLKATNVISVRALWVDLDGAPVEPVLACQLPPRIVVESSPGRWHCYWPVADLPLGQFSSAQKALAAAFGGDPSVSNVNRVMRLPGFLHCKAEPRLSRLERADPTPCTWDEMTRAFDLSPVMQLAKGISEGERNNSIFKLARSACQKGVPEAAQLSKALKVNESFNPPLSATEVENTVRSAYRGPATGAAVLPIAVMDSDAFAALDNAGRLLMMVAYRRADSFNAHRMTLPWSEARRWFPREETFYRVRDRAVESGLLQIVEAPTPKAPKKGRGPTPTFYRLAIPPIGVGYSEPRIPPVGVGPEALQALSLCSP